MKVHRMETTNNKRKELIETKRREVRTDLKLSVVSVNGRTKRWREKFRKRKSQPAAIVRNPELCAEHDAFHKLVDDGKYMPGDFLKYLADKEAKS
jgi:hypothetical protein